MARGKTTPIEKIEEVKAAICINPEASIRDLGKIVNLPFNTVRDIKNNMSEDEYNQYRAEQKKNAIVKAWDIQTSYMDHLKEPEVIAKASARDTVIVIGTLIDKAQLLAGEATQIVETGRSIPDLIADAKSKVIELEKLTSSN